MDTMKAMVLREYGKPLEYQEVPIPELGPLDTLVKVAGCGVCATDLKKQAGKGQPSRLPLILGHEIAGEVAAVGSDVAGIEIGQHVVAYHRLTCGNCEFCRQGRENLCENCGWRIGTEVDGGFAQYVRVPARNLVPIRADLPLADASVIPGAMAGPYHCMRYRLKIVPGERLAVVGTGGVGIHAVQVAREFGAFVIGVDVFDEKLALARKFGAQATINATNEDVSEAARRIGGGKGLDAVIQCVAGKALGPATESALEALRKGGRLALIGYEYGESFPVESQSLVFREIEIYGSLSYNRQDLIGVARLVEAGRAQPVVSTRLPLTEANQALEAVRDGSQVGRVVLIPDLDAHQD